MKRHWSNRVNRHKFIPIKYSKWFIKSKIFKFYKQIIVRLKAFKQGKTDVKSLPNIVKYIK